MNVFDLPDTRLPFPSAARLRADHYEGDAYYDRQSLHDSCAIGGLCFLAMLVIGLIGVALHILGLSIMILYGYRLLNIGVALHILGLSIA